MSLPLNVLNRLRLGRDMAAEIRATLPHHRAWVYIFPLLDSEKGYRTCGYGGEEQIVAISEGNPIRGFLVRHLEIEASIAEDHDQGRLMDYDDIGTPIFDDRIVVANEEELASVLLRWLSDFTTLHVPNSVGYIFANGHDLMN